MENSSTESQERLLSAQDIYGQLPKLGYQSARGRIRDSRDGIENADTEPVSSGGVSEEEEPILPDNFPFRLSGTYSLDLGGNPSDFRYSVQAGSYKQKGQANTLSYAGVTGQTFFMGSPARPHFYLSIPVQEGTFDALSGAVVFQSSELRGSPFVIEENGLFVVIYIGSFSSIESGGRIGVIQGQSDDIEYVLEQDDEGLLIFRADGTQEFIPNSNILAGYNSSNDANWSLQFAVTFTRLVSFGTTAPFGTSATDRFDGDAGNAQTFYRLPVIRTVGGIKQKLSVGGVYRENIVCVSGVPIVELLKIG